MSVWHFFFFVHFWLLLTLNFRCTWPAMTATAAAALPLLLSVWAFFRCCFNCSHTHTRALQSLTSFCILVVRFSLHTNAGRHEKHMHSSHTHCGREEDRVRRGEARGKETQSATWCANGRLCERLETVWPFILFGSVISDFDFAFYYLLLMYVCMSCLYVCVYILYIANSLSPCRLNERKRSEPRTPAVGDQMLSVAA